MEKLGYKSKVGKTFGWLAMLLCCCVSANAQVIWTESFNYPDGTTTGLNNNTANPAVDWTSSCATCVAGDWFEVRSNQMEGRDTNGPTELETETIDISSLPGGARVTINLSEQGTMEGCPSSGTGFNSVDWVRVEYKLDNNPWLSVGSPQGGNCGVTWANGTFFTLGDFGSAVVNLCPLQGDSLRLRLGVQCWAEAEYIRIDDIVVQGQNCIPPVGTDSLVQISCNGANDGEIHVSATGFAPPFTYSLNGGPFQSSGVFTNLAPGTYTVVVQDANGLTDQLANLVIIEPPAINAGTSSTPADCGIPNGSAAVSVTGGTPPYTYSWNTPTPVTTPTISNQLAGTYQVTITDANGCTEVVSVNIPQNNTFPITASGPDSICAGGTAQLFVTNGGGDPPISYAWSCNQPICGLDSVNDDDPLASPAATTVYYVQGTDASGCLSDVDSVAVFVLPPFPVDAGGDQILCIGDSIDLIGTVPGGGNYSFEWSNPAGQILNLNGSDTLGIRPQQDGFYIFQAFTSNGCASITDTVLVTVEFPHNHPAPDNFTSCYGEPLTVGVDSLPGYTYFWTTPSTLQNLHSSLTEAVFYDSQVLNLSITDESLQTENCRTRDFPVNITLASCVLPNVLTPNGDGVNDRLNLGDHLNEVDLYVYDRWGVEVYAEKDYQNEWYGTNKEGVDLPVGVYYYVVEGYWMTQQTTDRNGTLYRQVHSITLLR